MNTEKQRITIDATIAQVTGLDLPFSSCLNAMHEAEKTKEMHWDQKWVETIIDVALRESAIDSHFTNGYDWVLLVARLTPAQRAEAFLRTIGKWAID